MAVQMTRRSKILIPDSEKDDKYWEKRKRNNMAAKKSREAKRGVESAIRQKVFELEKENSVLRKELSLIKSRFGIPQTQCLLTFEDREECGKIAEEATSRSMSPIIAGASNHSCFNKRSSCDSDSAMHPFTDLHSNGFRESEAHAREPCHSVTSNTGHVPPSDIVYMYEKYNTRVPPIVNVSPSATADFYEDVYTVRDLSVKSRKRSIEYGSDDADDSVDVMYVEVDANNRVLKDSDRPVNMCKKRRFSERSESSDFEMPNVREDLKGKLEALSEQVQSMYRIMYS